MGPTGTGIENTDNFEDNKLRSCQLRSLQRRFVVQQTFGTPEPLPGGYLLTPEYALFAL